MTVPRSIEAFRKYDYANELNSLASWQHLILVTGVASRTMPPYELLSSEREFRIYSGVVEELWQARNVNLELIREYYESIVSLWPDEGVEVDVLTPFYWKVDSSLPLKIGLECFAENDSIEAIVRAERNAILNIQDFEGKVTEAGISLPLEGVTGSRTPYSEREFENFLKSVEILRSEEGEAAVQRIRELSEAEASFMRQELLPLWVRAQGWSQEDLESAHGTNPL